MLFWKNHNKGSEINLSEHVWSATPSQGSESSNLKAEESPALGRMFQAEETARTTAWIFRKKWKASVSSSASQKETETRNEDGGRHLIY